MKKNQSNCIFVVEISQSIWIQTGGVGEYEQAKKNREMENKHYNEVGRMELRNWECTVSLLFTEM